MRRTVTLFNVNHYLTRLYDNKKVKITMPAIMIAPKLWDVNKIFSKVRYVGIDDVYLVGQFEL